MPGRPRELEPPRQRARGGMLTPGERDDRPTVIDEDALGPGGSDIHAEEELAHHQTSGAPSRAAPQTCTVMPRDAAVAALTHSASSAPEASKP